MAEKRFLVLYDLRKSFEYCRDSDGRILEIRSPINFFHDLYSRLFISLLRSHGAQPIQKSVWLCDSKCINEFNQLCQHLPLLIESNIHEKLAKAKNAEQKQLWAERLSFFRSNWASIKPKIAIFEIVSSGDEKCRGRQSNKMNNY